MDNRERYYTRGYLPHWNAPGATQFLTWRLADSLPAHVWAELMAEFPLDDPEKRKRLWREQDRQLDRGLGACELRHSLGGGVCMEHLLNHHARSYVLEAFVVMPNHVHALITADPTMSLASLMQLLKGRSSTLINRNLGRSGRLWQPDYFDRRIRSEEHLRKTVEYIEWNPVKAGLCADPKHFRLSSANPQVLETLRRTKVRGPDAD